ncbi:hypothetical protein XENOCAPTIV_022380 [Xenoophorus captivus]|uniref:Uncharacterized protein n=1 Tax=Xenoophorus captivus TaxID=1517983 RepID=A0ABV0QT50_9TELE
MLRLQRYSLPSGGLSVNVFKRKMRADLPSIPFIKTAAAPLLGPQQLSNNVGVRSSNGIKCTALRCALCIPSSAVRLPDSVFMVLEKFYSSCPRILTNGASALRISNSV